MGHLKTALLWLLLSPVAMFSVFMGQLLGYAVMMVGAFMGHRYVFRRMSESMWGLIFGEASWDEKKVWLVGVFIVLLLFGILFAHLSASPVKKGRYIRRGLLSCIVLGMTAGVSHSALELSLYPERTLHWEPGRGDLIISFMGVSMMLYYLIRRRLAEP